MTVQEAISYIERYTWSTTRLGLERTRELLQKLGDPQKKLKFIHVTGSNGKGSTCAMLDSILRKAGYRTGLYTSPYIQDFCERMRVDGKNIPGEALAAITERVRDIAENMDDHPSQFELVTAIAMEYFFQKKCDIVVLEVGMGGALDSTNAIDAPEAAVITNIGLEHTEYLGSTIAEIAATKAGIIKPGCHAVCYDGDRSATRVVREVCEQLGVPVNRADFSRLASLSYDLDGQDFTYRGTEYHISLLGPHQLCNAAMALETVAALRARGWNISDSAVHEGLADAQWPARLEVLNRSPLFLLDGGHNPQCAQALADSLKVLLPGQKVVFLAGVLADKDYPTIIDILAPCAREFVCLTPFSDRALPAEKFADYLTGRGLTTTACDDVPSGIRAALSAAGDTGIVVAFGSLYLAGHVRGEFPAAFRSWLRREKIRARDNLTPEQRQELSLQAVERVLASGEFQTARTVLLYRVTRGELRLDGLEYAPEAQGKRFVYPRCVSDTEMAAFLPKGEDAWAPGNYGILEPVPEKSEPVPPEDIDLVLCPCTVFDEACHRMGMGAGFYDRYLERCTNAAIAAVAFEVQKVTSVPAAPWDKPMDAVFTEKAVYRRKAD